MTTSLRRFSGLLFLMAGCSGDTRIGHTYNWPEGLAYRMDFISEAQSNLRPLARFAETKTMRLMLRGDRHLVVFDSVLKTVQESAGVALVPFELEDTIALYVVPGPRGELANLELICDPAVAECASALPSIAHLELRRVIPRLPVAELNVGTTWADTLRYDEAARPRGTRGSVLTTYTVSRDTTIEGVAYQVIGWRSSRQSFRRSQGAGIAPEPIVIEIGATLIDRGTGLPAMSSWAGTSAVTAELRAAGATSTGFRGRAYRAGTRFDSLYSRQMMP